MDYAILETGKEKGGSAAMAKRVLSLILCLMMFVLLIPSAAMAWDGIVAVTLDPGDTVIDICRIYGTDYYEAKDLILILNGFEEEWQLGVLYPGNTILIPVKYNPEPDYDEAENEDTAPEDAVLFYVIPYTIQNGDTIDNIYSRWGLRYETYADMIRSLNGVLDLDSLAVGTTYYLPTTWENTRTAASSVAVACHIMRYGENAYDVFYDYGINYNRYYTILQSINGWRDLSAIGAGDQLLIPVV